MTKCIDFQNFIQNSSFAWFQVIILGDAGVGKTCLSFRFCNGRFPAQTEATIGVDFRERSVVIDGELIRVNFYFFVVYPTSCCLLRAI